MNAQERRSALSEADRLIDSAGDDEWRANDEGAHALLCLLASIANSMTVIASVAADSADFEERLRP